MSRLRRLVREEGGAAAVEMALIGAFMGVGLMNAAEVARYAYASSQVTAASQAAAQAALTVCDPAETPVTTNCPEAAAAITAAIGGSALGAQMTLQGGLEEGWYCLNAARALQLVGAAASRPANCGAAGDVNTQPALYLRVRTAHPYAALFPGLTLAEAFPATIVRTAWMRML